MRFRLERAKIELHLFSHFAAHYNGWDGQWLRHALPMGTLPDRSPDCGLVQAVQPLDAEKLSQPPSRVTKEWTAVQCSCHQTGWEASMTA